jgi:hypothetical protein
LFGYGSGEFCWDGVLDEQSPSNTAKPLKQLRYLGAHYLQATFSGHYFIGHNTNAIVPVIFYAYHHFF